MREKMRNKMNNKGFSLVELIVVIAIMAVLIGVLAPTLLGNIEKSRLSKDKSSADALYQAMVNAAGDPDVKMPTDTGDDKLSVSSTNGTFTIPTVSDDNDFWKKVTEYLGKKTEIKFESQVYGEGGKGTIKATVDKITRNVTVEGEGEGLNDNEKISLGK